MQLQEATAKLDAADAKLVAISVDGLDETREMAAKLGIEFPLLGDTDAQVVAAYGLVEPKLRQGKKISGPATFVIKGGKVVFLHVGESPRDRPTLDQILDTLTE